MKKRNLKSIRKKLGVAEKPFAPKNLVENYNILTEAKNKQVKKLKEEMKNVRKRLREDSLSDIEAEMIKKQLIEHVLEEEKYTEQDDRVLVNKMKVVSAIKFLKTKRKVNKKVCNKSDCTELLWDSPTVVIRHIRSCILNHDWNQLTRLLLLMLYCNRRYLPYIKMVSIY